jgi:hypothetical protein
LAVRSLLYTEAIPVCVSAQTGEENEKAAIRIPVPTAVKRRHFIQ